MPSDYCAVLFWWVLFVTLIFDGVRPSDGQEHGQGHGQANKQGIRQSPSLKIYILTISNPPVILQLFFIPSDYCVVLLYSIGSTAFTFLSPGHGQAHGQAK